MSEIEIFKQFISIVEKATEKHKIEQAKAGGVMEFVGSFCEDIRHYENYHSNLLVYLLNPMAGHRHGSEYLKLFLKQINIPLDIIDKVGDGSGVNVSREAPADGRVDILIKSASFVIVIENKIRAGDQENQLSRYYASFKDKYELNKNLFIVYLTLDGKSATDYSFYENDKADSKDSLKNNIINISYGTHILDWLSQLPTKRNEHFIRSALDQYIYTIQKLTGKTTEEMGLMSDINEKLFSELENLSDKEIDSLSKIILPRLLAKSILSRVKNNLIKKDKNINENSLWEADWKLSGYYWLGFGIPIKDDICITFEIELTISDKIDCKISGYRYGLTCPVDKRTDNMRVSIKPINQEPEITNSGDWYHQPTWTDTFDEANITDAMYSLYNNYKDKL